MNGKHGSRLFIRGDCDTYEGPRYNKHRSNLQDRAGVENSSGRSDSRKRSRPPLMLPWPPLTVLALPIVLLLLATPTLAQSNRPSITVRTRPPPRRAPALSKSLVLRFYRLAYKTLSSPTTCIFLKKAVHAERARRRRFRRGGLGRRPRCRWAWCSIFESPKSLFPNAIATNQADPILSCADTEFGSIFLREPQLPKKQPLKQPPTTDAYAVDSEILRNFYIDQTFACKRHGESGQTHCRSIPLSRSGACRPRLPRRPRYPASEARRLP